MLEGLLQKITGKKSTKKGTGEAGNPNAAHASENTSRPPAKYDKICDISYGPFAEYNLMDLYLPTTKAEGGFPVIISVHGGAYVVGSKAEYRGYCLQFVKAGFAVFNINYRLAPKYLFPAPLEDLNRVLLWLEEHGGEYPLDLNQIYLIGDSAGAQIASQYATIMTNPDYAKLFNFSLSKLKIRKLSLACGLYDIEEIIKDKALKSDMQRYVGKGFDWADERLKAVNYISEDFPETFLFSGRGDFLLKECEPMAKRLQEKGIPCRWEIFPKEGKKKLQHVFHLNFKDEIAMEANQMQFDFLH